MKKKVYLAGGMEKAEALGAGWRLAITPKLELMGFEVFDPVKLEKDKIARFPKHELPTEFLNEKTNKMEELRHWHQLKFAKSDDLKAIFKEYMEVIIRFDLNIVDQMTHIICLWDSSAQNGAGTSSELTWAYMGNKKVYTVATCELPGWASGCCNGVFDNFEDLYKHLEQE